MAQIVIAAFVAVLTVCLLYLIARRYLSDWVAWALAVSFWLSTPLVSTNATAHISIERGFDCSRRTSNRPRLPSSNLS